MTIRFIMAGAAFAFAAGAPAVSIAATQQGIAIVAENDQHKGEHGQNSQQSVGQQSHTSPGQPMFHMAPQGQMSGPSHTSTMMGGQNQTGGGMTGKQHHEHTGNPNFMNFQNVTPGSSTGGGMMGTQHHQHTGAPNFMNGRGNTMMERGTSRQNFDRHAFQRNFRASRQFRIGVYRRPHGWYYRRWVFGEFLPAFFWTQNYWLSDYYDYDLPDPPPGFIWVRYGDDALLVDEDSGEILEVEYGLFD